jgi:transcriptional regulator with XRE-family HTH domain
LNAFIFSIGQKIRARRTEKGMTLAELGSIVNTSTSLISQLERGGVNPSISLLHRIASALEVRIPDLLEEEEPDSNQPFVLTPIKEAKTLKLEGGVIFSLLSRFPNTEFELLAAEYPPGSSTGKEQYTHEGMECTMILEGELELEIGDHINRLNPGDCICFRSNMPHRICNKNKKVAKAIVVNSEPFVFATK